MIVVDAFLEPFASKFLAKKMMLKHAFGSVPSPVPPPKVQYGALFYGGHFEHYPQPSSPPQPSYPAYGPEPSYTAYGPEPSAPSYGPPSFSGYDQPAPPVVVVKPHPPSPTIGCLPASNPSPQVDYSGYVVHGGHGFGSYGNNGNGGTYGK